MWGSTSYSGRSVELSLHAVMKPLFRPLKQISTVISGAICYIELACVVPLSGGETVYLKAAFGDFVSFVFSWLRAVVLGPSR